MTSKLAQNVARVVAGGASREPAVILSSKKVGARHIRALRATHLQIVGEEMVQIRVFEYGSASTSFFFVRGRFFL